MNSADIETDIILGLVVEGDLQSAIDHIETVTPCQRILIRNHLKGVYEFLHRTNTKGEGLPAETLSEAFHNEEGLKYLIDLIVE